MKQDFCNRCGQFRGLYDSYSYNKEFDETGIWELCEDCIKDTPGTWMLDEFGDRSTYHEKLYTLYMRGRNQGADGIAFEPLANADTVDEVKAFASGWRHGNAYREDVFRRAAEQTSAFLGRNHV